MEAERTAPEGWTVDPIEPEIWRDRFYIRGVLWIPNKQYEYDSDSPISVHFEVFETWKSEDGTQRFLPCNGKGATEPDEEYRHLTMSIKWDGCSDFDLEDGHRCSATEAFETGELLAHLYEIAEGFFPQADGDFEVKR